MDQTSFSSASWRFGLIFGGAVITAIAAKLGIYEVCVAEAEIATIGQLTQSVGSFVLAASSLVTAGISGLATFNACLPKRWKSDQSFLAHFTSDG